jgi:hypothetical protein
MSMAVLLLSLVLPFTAGAAATLKPGLWEMAMKSDMVKEMPKLTPEQLAQIKKMGIEMPQMQNGAVVTKVCITPEMAERNQTPDMGGQHECKAGKQNRSGDMYTVNLICDGPNIKGEGVIKGTIVGGERVNSTYDFSGTSLGKPVKQHHETSGKWLGADCGNIKPIGELAAEVKKRKLKN